MQEHQCRSCGCQIVWIHTASGNLHAINADPDPKGDGFVLDGKLNFIRNDLFEQMLPEGPRYQSHFATCKRAVLGRITKEKP